MTVPYSHLAVLFDFPDASFRERVRDCLASLRALHSVAAAAVTKFLEGLPAGMDNQQELYTRSFDVQAMTTLDVGYVLFGDDYKRAELLSHLTREHARVENDCGGELADHLPNLIRLLPKLEDTDLARELTGEILIPALMLMIREFDPARIEKKNENYQRHYKTLIAPAPGSDSLLYRHALQAVLDVLAADFGMHERVSRLEALSLQRGAPDFLGRIEKEMQIEKGANPMNSGKDC